VPPEVTCPPLDWTGLLAGACRLLELFDEFEELDELELEELELEDPVDPADPELVEACEPLLALDVPLPDALLSDFVLCDVVPAEDLAV
jgi:hypothetical protein